MNSTPPILDKIKEGQLNNKDRYLLSKIWQSSSKTTKRSNKVSSGHSELDELLTDGGWPLGIPSEIGLIDPGIGEMRLIVPALCTLQQGFGTPGNIVWISPPFEPLAQSLINEGLDLEHLTVVEASKAHDSVWAAEQALLSRSCAAVILWTGKSPLSNKQLRRLQLASEGSTTWTVIFRHSSCLEQSSVSHLRANLSSTAMSELRVDILKQSSSWGNKSCTISLSPHYERWQRLPVDLLPDSNRTFNHDRRTKPSLPIDTKVGATNSTLAKTGIGLD